MARNTSRVARAFGREDGLHLRLEILEIERRRRSSWLLHQQCSNRNQGKDWHTVSSFWSSWRMSESDCIRSRQNVFCLDVCSPVDNDAQQDSARLRTVGGAL